ncbi:lactonase family protein [Archangium violaceum]|uniref:3-carboxymuconate cyclase n=1 Tax=Archangium violaceum Cb vi76 TaxID=1406225 RepID=A0A084SHN7_9BACT|nr:beta-propeller fold lactonase family protein [Archangium violaceum]KFA87972.1 hypothetical protein Q664_44245 [Archangium violaceum Cb vi76]
MFKAIKLGLGLVTAMLLAGWDGTPRQSTVYTVSNDAEGNAVAVFIQEEDGTLSAGPRVATGGRGTGSGLGNQGALALSEDERFLFVINAGSNDLSSFRVLRSGPKLLGRVPSGGTTPVSLTVHGELLYVLNAGDGGNISGFRVGSDGGLTPLPDSIRPLSGAAVTAPAQVSFSPDGSLLVVTEKATNLIDTYTVDVNGRAHGPIVQSSEGPTPFGFAFDKRGRLFVSEAAAGVPNGSALSSYHVDGAGRLSLQDQQPSRQTAACWVVVTRNGRYAYTSNTGSASITGYRIFKSGNLSLLDSDGVTASAPEGSVLIDMSLSDDSRYLYVLDSQGAVRAYRVGDGGGLSGLGSVPAPAGSTGLLFR